jgi:hypothetical protein
MQPVALQKVAHLSPAPAKELHQGAKKAAGGALQRKAGILLSESPRLTGDTNVIASSFKLWTAIAGP